MRESDAGSVDAGVQYTEHNQVGLQEQAKLRCTIYLVGPWALPTLFLSKIFDQVEIINNQQM